MIRDLRAGAGELRGLLGDRAPGTPPAETGKRLATIPRTSQAGNEELRVTWAEYEGKPFVSLRVWTRSNDGTWWPSKTKGLSVRVRELPAFAEGIAAAMDEARAHAAARPAAPAPGPATRALPQASEQGGADWLAAHHARQDRKGR